MNVPRPPPFAGALRLGDDGRSSRELLAGVTLAALALPLNIGYATAAGLPPTVGIYATLLPAVVFALTTGSTRLVVGPDATIAALLAAALAPVVAGGVDPEEAAWATALVVGATMLVFWALRLGGLVRFVSKAVLVGFIAGLGIEVLTSQIRKMMGVDVDAASWPGEVIELVRAVPDLSGANLAVGVGTVVSLRVLRRLAPRVPAALLVLAFMTTVVAILEPGGVDVLGSIPSGLPAPALPTLGLEVWLDLVAVAVTIAVLTTAEGALLAQQYARRFDEQLDSNGEVFALGASNVAAAVTGGMPIGASASRTAALSDAGSRTQTPLITAAAVVAVVVVAVPGLVARLPAAALAGLVANAVVSTIEVSELRRFGRLRRSELAIALGCAAGVLLIGPMGGIVLAVLISTIDVVRRVAAAPWAEVGADTTDPATGRFRAVDERGTPSDGLRIVRPVGPLFFATADSAREVLEAAALDPTIDWIVLDFEGVSDVDPTAAEALLEGIETARRHATVVALTRTNRSVRHLLDRYEITDAIGPSHIYDSNRGAHAAHRQSKSTRHHREGAPEMSEIVNVENFVRAETSRMFADLQRDAGGINILSHNRAPASVEQQTVIRMNRDTLYSFAVTDISEGATLTIPEFGDRYVSVMVVNEDHYVNEIMHDPGVHELTTDRFESRYVVVAVRVLVDPADPSDVAAATQLQDGFSLDARSATTYEAPDVDAASLDATRRALGVLASGLADYAGMFGRREEVDPVRHLIGTAAGWGGLPTHEATYVGVEPNLAPGTYELTVHDVPVDGFWSISVYDRDGYFEPNPAGAYSINSVTAAREDDGSVVVRFGDHGPDARNCIPTPEGWNYLVRLYRPRREILDGTWKFPTIEGS